jgi:G3E family GTPase
MPDPRIPAHLIIGATGAGKTALVSRLIARRAQDEGWGVLVNDFGRSTLARDDAAITVREVAGCICCTAHVALRTALVALLREARPQRVFIEASAAAHPAALMKVLSEPGLASVIELHSTLCVVSAGQLADPRYVINAVYREQVAAADGILLNAPEGDATAARAKIDRMRVHAVAFLDPAVDVMSWLKVKMDSGGRRNVDGAV